MPALCAATRSFHVKSPTTYLITALVMVRVLSFVLTVVLIFSVTLFVSIFGVRSYSDQRYSSMQISATRHSLGVSIGRTAGFGYTLTSFKVDRLASCTRVSSCGAGPYPGKVTSETGAFSDGSGSVMAALPTVTAGSGKSR